MGKRTRAAAALAASSLSSFLVAPGSGLDNDIFSNSAGPSIAFAAKKADKKEKKAKKAASPIPVAPSSPPAALDSDEEADVANDAELSEADSDEVLDLPSDSDDDDGVEEAYAAKQAATRLKALAEGGKSKKRKAGDSDEEESEGEEEEEEEQSGDESELDLDNLVHESLLPKALYKEVAATPKDLKKAKAARTKAASTETPAERDVRTLFLGNVPVSCSTSRPSKKALLRHVLNSPALLALLPPTCPPLKADSIRFRSLAFASTVFGRKATAEAPADNEPAPEAGGRGRKRAREWRDTEGTDERGVKGGFHAKEAEKKAKEDAAAAAKGHKGALTDGQKRRVAFIRGELNEGKKACNAYLVLEAFPASYSGLSTLDFLTALVAATDGSVFEGFTLRADHVRPRSAAATMAAAQMASKPSKQDSLAPPNTGASYTVPPIEARRTIFMGGLDFAENEENVRAATEAVLVKERGEAGSKGWVERVRLIRDASTGLGKGFGYVLLRDAECVDEILALPPGFPLKVSKRKVRLERCKTGVAAARAKASAAAKEVKAAAEAKNPTTAFAPRDPATLLKRAPKLSAANSESAQQARIAQALAKLPAGERKAIKAVDPERLMRRAQKKKNKVLGERYERKKAGADKSILGRESRSAERTRKEKKRVKAGNVTGKRAKKIK